MNTTCILNHFNFFFLANQLSQIIPTKETDDFREHDKLSILCVIKPIIFQTYCLSHTGRASKEKIVDVFLATCDRKRVLRSRFHGGIENNKWRDTFSRSKNAKSA